MTPLCRLFCKRGVFNREILGKTLGNHPFSETQLKRKCKIPNPDECKESPPPPPRAPDELRPCYPDCRPGEPNMPTRGCLPWEKGVEICPKKTKARALETKCCEHLCAPYVGQNVIDKLKTSACEYRKFKKEFVQHRKISDENWKLEPGPIRKLYPMLHAVNKKFLPGCPRTSHKHVKKVEN